MCWPTGYTMNVKIAVSHGLAMALLVPILMYTGNAQSQYAFERYIPIGQSPGMSEKYTYIGKIRAVDTQTRALEVREKGVRYAVNITGSTKIWLDRSKSRRQNQAGSLKDCRKGRRVEIKFTDANRDTAAWIKVESR